jgi:hypothetical protein
MRPHNSLIALAFAALIGVTSCSTKYSGQGEDARGLSSVKIDSGDRYAIEEAISDAFVDDGFRYSRAVGDTITFHKKGQRNAIFAYSDLTNSNDIWIEATVTIAAMGTDAHRVRCDAKITQVDRGMGFSDQSPMFVGKMGYVGLLKKAKKQVEKG